MRSFKNMGYIFYWHLFFKMKFLKYRQSKYVWRTYKSNHDDRSSLGTFCLHASRVQPALSILSSLSPLCPFLGGLQVSPRWVSGEPWHGFLWELRHSPPAPLPHPWETPARVSFFPPIPLQLHYPFTVLPPSTNRLRAPGPKP